jgi:selenocysteine-specific elongation factor
MPVDRVFSLKGIGTVVTGTLWSGNITSEDTVAILPQPSGRGLGEQQHVRVRSVQVHDREVAQAVGGQRVALNLTGVDRQAVSRGQWVVKDPSIAPSFLVDVHMSLLTDVATSLPRVTRVRVDHGTAELLAKVVLADRESLSPGDSCYAQLRFEQSVLMYPGDQFILRSITPVTTLGGGRVVDPAAHKHGTAAEWRKRLATLEDAGADTIAELLLEECFPWAMTRGQLEESPYLWRFAAPERAAPVAALLADGRATSSGLRLFHGPSLSRIESDAAAKIGQKSETDPLNPYYTLGELRRELAGGKDWPALDAALEELQSQGAVVRTEHGYISSKAAAADVSLSEKAQLLLQVFSAPGPVEEVHAGDNGLGAETPSVAVAADAAEMTAGEAQRIIDALVRQGRLVRVGEDFYYPPARLDSLTAALTEAMRSKGLLTLAEARDLLATSRKYAQALLEHMDSEGLTLRVGDARRLRRRR